MSITTPDIVGSTASSNGARIERKLLMTVCEWTEGSGTSATTEREVIGIRTEDSSIELNPDIETTTDIYGNTYNEINKTEPQQDFDQPILEGSEFAEYLFKAMMENRISAYNGQFTLYIIALFIQPTSGHYYAVKHEGCSIIPSNVGGSTKLAMSTQVKFSNNITVGSVEAENDGKVASDFTFTPA